MAEIESLQGIVDRVIYQNQENGFAVFIVQVNAKNSVTVKGSVPTITAGEQVLVRGVWNMHQKFGKQFDAHSCEKQAPTSILGLKKYLGSGLIKGIGPVYGDKLVAAFGEKVLEIIDTQSCINPALRKCFLNGKGCLYSFSKNGTGECPALLSFICKVCASRNVSDGIR